MSELQSEIGESPKEMHLPYLKSKSEQVVPQPISGDVCDNKNDCFVNVEKSHLGISENDDLLSRLETNVPDTACVEYLCSGNNPEPTKCRVLAQSVEESDNKEEELLKDDRLLKENKDSFKIVDVEINDNSLNSVCILEDSTKDIQVVNGDPGESIALDTSEGIGESKCSELLSNESEETFESTIDNDEELSSVFFDGVNQQESLEGSEVNPVSASNSEYSTLNIHGNETREDNQTSHTNSESSLGGIIRSVCGRRPVRKTCFKAQNRPLNVEGPVKNEVDDLGSLEANMFSLKRKSFDSDTVILKKPKIDDSTPLFSVVSSHFHVLRNKLSDRIIEKKQVYSEDTICDKSVTNLKGIAENPTTKDNSNHNVYYKISYQNSWCSVM